MGSCCGKPERSGAGRKSGMKEKKDKGRRGTGKTDSEEDIPPSRPLLTNENEKPAPTAVQIDPSESRETIETVSSREATRRILPSIQQPNNLIPIKFAPADQWQQCAYCDDPAGDRYDYFYCPEMPCELLEDLMEHGWWRTGQVIFKPRFKEVCCPGYALRMPAAQFVPSKSQKRIIRKWRNFLMYGDPRWENRSKKGAVSVGVDEVDSAHNVTEVRAAVGGTPELIQAAVASGTGGPSVECGDVEPQQQLEEVIVQVEEMNKRTIRVEDKENRPRQRKPVTPGRGPDPNRPPCKKAKERRMEKRRQKKLASPNTTPPKSVPQPPKKASLQELMEDLTINHKEEWRHRLEVKLLSCNPTDPQLSATLEQAYRIYDKFQRVVHPGKIRFNSSYEFKWGFMNTPLETPPDRYMGTYHMHYYLDGELIMISILDILPQYFVSIYFIYDPDIRFMTPGIFTCLQELELVQRIQREQPKLTYFALGYYNHFDSKVSYKRQFGPQEVLCNETDVFVPLKDAIPKFYIKRYIRLVDDDSIPEKEGRTASIDNLIVRTYLGALPFRLMSRNPPPAYQKALREFISETGSASAHRFLIQLV